MSLVDYKVPFRSEAFIAEIAMKCWRIGTVPGSKQVDLKVILTELEAHGVESIAHIHGMRRKGRLKIEIIDDCADPSPACVDFRPTLKLRVQQATWQRFQLGHSEERVIIAHEIGHILLHSDQAKRFSRDPTVQIQFAENEDSAEGQANLFADHLLIPTHIATQLNDVDRLAFICNVPEDFARDRLTGGGHDKYQYAWSSYATGAPCANCGDFSVIGPFGRRRCTSCGGCG
ncbi:hypothetical protein BRAS3843_1060035 [Bradyrhizobium sp. STM 3843]|uniref:ImmA/IrrE family metallo-endopeptidase n=1 Tax=Bradyrhizobium sp. STM 3843 TaxID=551947 RepID=UPI000240A423|nr:ImmA/IrrE family metallo-endopeptidase [Bradyrhizobium sp. STM 3843]CCE04368.1 hypothetical protein BRAS3843_1060035 [Bradyrhizobium sp. STM 3843]